MIGHAQILRLRKSLVFVILPEIVREAQVMWAPGAPEFEDWERFKKLLSRDIKIDSGGITKECGPDRPYSYYFLLYLQKFETPLLRKLETAYS